MNSLGVQRYMKIPKRFLIDVDGVVVDFIGTLFEDIENTYPDLIKPSEIVDWDIFNSKSSQLTSEQRAYAFELLNSPGYGKSFRLIEGAKEACALIKARGHEIRWVTASWESSETWDYDRVRLLELAFNAAKHDICFYYNKWEISGDFLIDDKIENITKWQCEQNGRGLLFDQPWNRNAAQDIERFSWDKLPHILEVL